MNPSYDVASAAQRLESLAQERADEKLAGIQLSRLEEDQVFEVVQVINDETTNTKRMILQSQMASGPVEDTLQPEATEHIELVWHIQGVLTMVELPPFIPKGNKFKEKVKFLRQGVRLSGLDTPMFTRAVQAIGEIVALYSRTVGTIQTPTFIGEDEQGIFLDTCNRYFSPIRDRRGGQPKLFDSDIDPTGALSAMGDGKYYHGEENSVMYLERGHDRLTKKKHMYPISPVSFKTGDITEAQITFALVPLKDNEWKMVATLRCIILLDRKFTQECIRNNIQFSGVRIGEGRRSIRPGKCLRRRTGYDLDDGPEDIMPYAKMARMDLGE